MVKCKLNKDGYCIKNENEYCSSHLCEAEERQKKIKRILDRLDLTPYQYSCLGKDDPRKIFPVGVRAIYQAARAKEISRRLKYDLDSFLSNDKQVEKAIKKAIESLNK